jgi:hypothetical protein
MRKYVCALVLANLALYAETSLLEDGSVSSTNASYDGNALLLQGHVQLDHGLGKLQKQETGKDFPFALIHLKKDVLLSMKNNAQIKCDTAELDFNTLQGHLFAKEQEKVSYIDVFKGKANKQTPFRLLSNAVEMTLAKNEKEGKKSDYEIAILTARDDVIIDYANAFVLRADHAVYHRIAGTEAGHNLSGSITAYPKNADARCILTHAGDIVESDQIDLDLTRSLLKLSKPKGSLASSLFSPHQKGQMQFICQYLTWDHVKQRLLLQEAVRIQDSFLGSLSSEQEVRIEQGESNGKKFIKNIHTEGLTHLEYKDPAKHWNHKLTCKGILNVDGQKGHVTLFSPQEKGKTLPDQQIYYEDEQMGVHADQAFIEYSEPTYEPVSLTLKGNVRIFSHDPGKPRCGLADRLVYSPNTKTLILSANPGKRVLFWDDEQGLRMSAQEVHLTEDPVTQQTQVKGVGNVQFSLSAEENETLRKFFPQYSQPQQENHE